MLHKDTVDICRYHGVTFQKSPLALRFRRASARGERNSISLSVKAQFEPGFEGLIT